MSNDIKEQVWYIRAVIEGRDDEVEEITDKWSLLEDALDIEYIISSTGEYLGARVLVTCGGPTIWVNTRTNTIEGTWWSDSYDLAFEDPFGIDDYLLDLHACL